MVNNIRAQSRKILLELFNLFESMFNCFIGNLKKKDRIKLY